MPDSEDWRKERLPARPRASRHRLLDSFLSQRATVRLPNPESLAWWLPSCLYYKPDSVTDIVPVEWEVNVEDCYTGEQAENVWRNKGCGRPDVISPPHPSAF